MRSCCSPVVATFQATSVHLECQALSAHNTTVQCLSPLETMGNCSTALQRCSQPPTGQHPRHTSLPRTTVLVNDTTASPPDGYTGESHHSEKLEQGQSQQSLTAQWS